MSNNPVIRNHRIVRLTLLLLTFALTVLLDHGFSPGESGKRKPSAAQTSFAAIRKATAAIRPLHSTMGKPKPGDWLAHHKETGQTFDEYMRDHKKRVRDQYETIYVQPLGEFEGAQGKLLK
jgi:hypothetical protein